MGRIGFFEALMSDGFTADASISWTERDAINSAHDHADAALDAVGMQAEGFGKAIARLSKRLHEQDQQIKMLNAAVSVLAAMLRDNGVVKAEMLDARLEAAMENARDDAAVTANTVTCQRCGAQVAMQRTVMTETGTICDACHARSG